MRHLTRGVGAYTPQRDDLNVKAYKINDVIGAMSMQENMGVNIN